MSLGVFVKLPLWLLMAADTLLCLIPAHCLVLLSGISSPSNQKATTADGFIIGTSNYFHSTVIHPKCTERNNEGLTASLPLFHLIPLIPNKQGE